MLPEPSQHKMPFANTDLLYCVLYEKEKGLIFRRKSVDCVPGTYLHAQSHLFYHFRFCIANFASSATY